MAYSVTTKKTWARILDDIEEQLNRWGGVSSWRVDTKLAPRSATKWNQTAEECRVALHYTRKGKDYQIVMGRQSRAVDNLLVIWLILETLRLNDARGYAKEVAEVYRQEFPALPAPGTTLASANTGPYAVLYVQPDAPLEICEAAYRALVKQHHPDVGGSAGVMERLNAAIGQIRKQHA